MRTFSSEPTPLNRSGFVSPDRKTCSTGRYNAFRSEGWTLSRPYIKDIRLKNQQNVGEMDRIERRHYSTTRLGSPALVPEVISDSIDEFSLPFRQTPHFLRARFPKIIKVYSPCRPHSLAPQQISNNHRSSVRRGGPPLSGAVYVPLGLLPPCFEENLQINVRLYRSGHTKRPCAGA